MMEGESSKQTSSAAPPTPPPPPPQAQPHTTFNVYLSSYETECLLDTDLQSFDVILQARTNRVISSLATGVQVQSLSLDSIREVTNSLLEMNQDVVQVIKLCKKDVWHNQELFSLVEDYFDNSVKTMDFCTSLENCLRRTRDNQLMIIQLAVRHFEKEVGGGIDGVKYVKTLQELRRFKATEDPFTEEFFVLFESVLKQHELMYEKLLLRKGKLDKKLKFSKEWRRVSNVIFVAAFLSVFILSVVAAAITAPPIVTAVAAALSGSMGPAGKWCNSLLRSYENSVKGQRGLVNTMHIHNSITMIDLVNIRVLVNKLEIGIDSLLKTADFALREEDVLKLVMEEIKKQLEVFMDTIENLIQHGHKCCQDITRARTVVLQTITKGPNN